MIVNKSVDDKEQLCKRIISESFIANPSVLSVLRRPSVKYLEALAAYAFRTSSAHEGAYFSKDGEAVALCYEVPQKSGFTIAGLCDEIRLVHRAIGWWRVGKILKREKYIKKHRALAYGYLYFWFLGATAQGIKNRSVWRLKDKLFEKSNATRLPILLETSVEQNRRVYERFGFKVYHQWEMEKGQPLYFMMREACN